MIKNLSYGKEIVFKNSETGRFNNIVCIQVESLDANIVDYQFKGKYIAPFLHELTFDSIYYPYLLTYPSVGATSDTEFTIINGLIPFRMLPYYSFTRYDYPNSLIKELSVSGFQTMAFHNNGGDYFNRNRTFAKMGFDKFYDFKKMELIEYGWGGKDGDLFNFVQNKLKQQKRPFMYYIITMSSHEPYQNVRLYYSNNHYDCIKRGLIRDYFNSMSYVDSALRDIVLFIKDNVPDTYIFIFGDHFFHSHDNILFKPSGLKYAGEYLMAVPLFIITPDGQRHRENNKIASMLDMELSILYASGISFDIKSKGIDLTDFSIREDRVILPFYTVGSRETLFKKFDHKKKEALLCTEK